MTWGLSRRRNGLIIADEELVATQDGGLATNDSNVNPEPSAEPAAQLRTLSDDDRSQDQEVEDVTDVDPSGDELCQELQQTMARRKARGRQKYSVRFKRLALKLASSAVGPGNRSGVRQATRMILPQGDAKELESLRVQMLKWKREMAKNPHMFQTQIPWDRPIPTDRVQMEADLAEWVLHLRSNSVRVTRIMILRRAVEVLQRISTTGAKLTRTSAAHIGGITDFCSATTSLVEGLRAPGKSYPRDGRIKRKKTLRESARRLRVYAHRRVEFMYQHHTHPERSLPGNFGCIGFQLSAIANCDHTPIYFEMVGSYTVDAKGTKAVAVKTGGMEKAKVTVQLTCTADGGKLPPLIIFRAEGYHWLAPHKRPLPKGRKKSATPSAAPGDKRKRDRHMSKPGTVWHELRHRLADAHGNPHPTSRSCHMITQPSSNSDRYCTQYYLSHVWRNRSSDPQPPSVLVWDSFGPHKMDAIVGYAKSRLNTDTALIRGGLTPILQPLDRVINKVQCCALGTEKLSGSI